ncbi:MAG: ribosomal protein S18-alanine N-acetyltransferase [Acidimicrobiia bacterium]|nr:MAG: ribosomal protein S18-alanine N-acetyltransferase [Acidimicrobiia bacterium]
MAVTAPVVRPMTAADVAGVTELEAASFPDPWSAAAFFEEIVQPSRLYLVVEDGGRVAGYGGIMIIEEDAHVMTIAVAPEDRRRRLGTRLMLGMVEVALKRGVQSLTLEVRPSNTAARTLYERFGFVEVGTRPGYYRDEDAIIMWVVDAAGPEYRARIDSIRGSA